MCIKIKLGLSENWKDFQKTGKIFRRPRRFCPRLNQSPVDVLVTEKKKSNRRRIGEIRNLKTRNLRTMLAANAFLLDY